MVSCVVYWNVFNKSVLFGVTKLNSDDSLHMGYATTISYPDHGHEGRKGIVRASTTHLYFSKIENECNILREIL